MQVRVESLTKEILFILPNIHNAAIQKVHGTFAFSIRFSLTKKLAPLNRRSCSSLFEVFDFTFRFIYVDFLCLFSFFSLHCPVDPKCYSVGPRRYPMDLGSYPMDSTRNPVDSTRYSADSPHHPVNRRFTLVALKSSALAEMLLALLACNSRSDSGVLSVKFLLLLITLKLYNFIF